MPDNSQTPKDFCFGCPNMDIALNPQARRIEQKLFNPWPVLAANPSPDKPRADPVTRMIYIPTYFPKPYTGLRAVQRRMQKRLEGDKTQSKEIIRSDLYTWTIWQHEFVHFFMLDWTPAKELAKLFLALSYTDIATLFQASYSPSSSREEIKKIWELFGIHSHNLNTLGASVSFVEELFAIALTLDGLEKQVRPGGRWAGLRNELPDLKEEWLSDYEKEFPGFRAMFENKQFQSLVRMIQNNLSFGAYVIPFLQPIRFENGKLFPIDSSERLNTILHLIKGTKNVKVAIQRLQPLEQELNQSWQAVLATQLDWVRHHQEGPGGYIRLLWETSRCHFKAEAIMNTEMNDQQIIETYCAGQRLLFQNRAGVGDNFYLHLTSSKEGDIITGVIVTDGKITDDEENRHYAFGIISRIEALRQQLRTKKGLLCPQVTYQTAKNPHVCYCPSEERNRMECFYHLAKDMFHHEESSSWSELFCKE